MYLRDFFALKPFLAYSLYLVCILPSVCSPHSAFCTQPAFYSQSAVCILHSVCILLLVRSLRSAVRSPPSALYVLHWPEKNFSKWYVVGRHCQVSIPLIGSLATQNALVITTNVRQPYTSFAVSSKAVIAFIDGPDFLENTLSSCVLLHCEFRYHLSLLLSFFFSFFFCC